MNGTTLVRRGLRHYRRTHLGVLIGCAISTAVLAGALFVGDSVRTSLERAALARLGRVVSAMETGDRYFRDDLPLRAGSGAAALRVRGMALKTGGGQVNRIELLGVDARFFALAETPASVTLGNDRVALGERLAAAIGAKAGDDVTLRFDKPSLLSKDAPLSSREERDTVRKRFTVAAVLSDVQLGRFSLRSDQSAALNAFVDRAWLQAELELEGWANLFAAPGEVDLAKTFTIEDAGLQVKAYPEHGVLQVQSPRVYLDPAGIAAVRAAAPAAAGVLSFLVNDLAAEGGTSTPYSFVTAGPVPADLKDDEILVNAWVAEQTGAKAGGRLTMAYFEIRPGNRYVEVKREFRIRGVLPMETLKAERALVPEFPGLTDVESCAKWRIGMPTDEKKVNDKANEAYWEKYKQTPKAFVTLAAGQAMWGNRFGDLMTLRLPAGDPAVLAAAIRTKLDPTAAGLVLRPARAEARRAAAESMDLGQLFLGMSAFLIGASLMLTAMLFVFSVEQRAREMGVLLATGFTPGRVRRLFMAEGAVIALLGALAGLPLGWGFAQLLVDGLRSTWSGAVASADIAFHARAASAGIAFAAGVGISLLAMAFALRRQVKRPVRELVAEDFTLSLEASGAGIAAKIVLATSLAAAGAVALALRTPPGFFGAGALLLVAGLAGLRIFLGRLATSSGALPTAALLGRRNAGRRPGRSLAAAGMLACGAFIVVAVSAMREDFTNSAGAGGFEIYAESSVPLTENLNDPKDRELLRLTGLEGVSVVAMKARDGDDASCLNLNQSLTPPLVGVDPSALSGRFGVDWKLLERDLGPDVVPAIVGDAATPLWKLKKSIGARLDYVDERGRSFKVELVAALPMRLSIFQGRLLVSEARFGERYPGEAGTRLFAVDVPPGREAAVLEQLTKGLDKAGFDALPASKRLERFYQVEATYLALFQVLGGLGVLLGSAGMGVLVLRNVMERRSELALLRAVGYTKAQAVGVVQTEHGVLVLAGLAAGTLASALAVLPSAARPDAQVPLGLLALFLAATAGLAFGWIALATRAAMRADLVRALRNE